MSKESILFKKLEEINAVLSTTYKELDHIGVLSGLSGVALFQFHYARLTGDESHADVGVEIISLIVEKINEGYNFPTFCTGIAGAAWAIELLKEEEFIDVDTDELLGDLDEYLVMSIDELAKKDGFYDFLHGVLGIGFYFLKRYERTESKELKKRYKEQLLHIVKLLEETAQRDGTATKWENVLIESSGLRGYNLSLSHGISSIVNFLSRLTVYDDFSTKATPILKSSIDYILKYERPDSTKSSLFPCWVYEGMEENESERLAWCYGDLGLGFTLWRAGKVLKDDRISQKGKLILEHSSKRRNVEEAKMKDAGLCHGAFGITQIYSYIYKETNEDVFKETADYWLEKGIEMSIHSDGYAGYMQWQGGENPGWRKETNLLEGIAGIGLAIISSLATFDSKWDECLLIG